MIIEICMSFFGRGAVMRRAREEVIAFLNAGHFVTVFTDLRHRRFMNSFKGFNKKFKIKPIKLLYLHRPIPKVSLRKVSSELSFAFQCYRALKNLSKKESIELIISHQATACYAVARFANKNKIPSAWVIQELIKDRIASFSNPYNWFTTQLYKHSTKYALSNIHYLIANSSYIKKLAIMEGAKAENTFVKHNSVDTKLFHPDVDNIKDVDILYFGRLSIEKGVNVLLEASKYLSKNRNVLIIGDGYLRKNLELQAQNLHCNIKFQGWVDHKLLPQFIRRAKLVVVPSLSEPQGVVVLEAMACGVPVIGTNIGGIPEMIKHNENGWLVKPNNPNVLGKMIEESLSSNKKLILMGQAAQKTAESYSINQFNRDIIDLYELLIDRFKS